jgi:signal transduction histidine kinase/ligand-binding sensor domain-containing protein
VTRAALLVGVVAWTLTGVDRAGRAATLWSDPGATLIHDTGVGRDILEGDLKRDETSSDTLYFRFRVDPLSDSTTEEYFAALQLFEGDEPRLGIGNASEAWAYAAFFEVRDPGTSTPVARYVDLRSSGQGAAGGGGTSNYELPRRGVERAIVFKIQYVAGGEDLVTVWLNPDLSPGATEVLQPETLTTRFSANASFDEIRLRHGGGGDGWVFSELSVASAFVDFVDPSSAMPRAATAGPLFSRERLSTQTWNREPRMPRGAISALAQTADGYLWLAGEDLLSRFDGVRFVGWDIPESIGGGAVTTLLGDSRGALWIGSSTHGLTRYSDGRFERFTTSEGLPGETITAIVEDSQGSLWVGTSSGLAVWQKDRLGPPPGEFSSLKGSAIKALFIDRSGALWIAAKDKGVFHHQPGSLSSVSNPQVEDWLKNPQCLLVGRDGKIWVGAGDDMVLCRDSGGWRRYRIPRRSGLPHVKALTEDADGTVWAGSASEGLFRFEQGRLVALNTSASLADNQVSAILMDRDGDLWIGGGDGLHALRREHHFKLGTVDGLGPGAVSAVAEVSPGVVWALQPGRGLFRWETRSFRRLNAAGLDPGDPGLGALLVTRDGGCWIACGDELRLYRDPQAVADESLCFAFPHGVITALAETDDRYLWVGTLDGQLWQFRQGQWIKHLQLESRAAIAALAPDRGGRVWVATDGDGLYSVVESVATRFSSEEGLLSDSVRALHRDANGVLWLGSVGGGLAGLAGRVAASFMTREGLPDNAILGILEDQAGRLWLNDNSGLTCVAKPALSAKSHRIDVLGVYPLPLGAVEELNPGEGVRIFPKSGRTSSGHLWFATHEGILVVEPHQIAAAARPADIILEAVLVDGVPVERSRSARTDDPTPSNKRDGGGGLHLGPGRHRVELQYTSPDLGARKRWKFRYRMLGLDEGWVDAGTARSAVYSYLPPGDYEFTVAALAPHGGSSQTSLRLFVAPHFWQRWSVIAGGVLGLVAMIASGARFLEKRRMDHRLRRLEQEHALERERTRIARDLHDEMGAKLCRISFLSEHAGRLEPAAGEIKEHIAAIADDSRELLHSLDEIVWVVNPQNDTLEHVVSYTGQYAQNYFNGTGIECEVDIANRVPDAAISSQVRHHLLLAVHEALTNVLKHSGATRVKVTIACHGSTFGIDLADNGGGFSVLSSPRGTLGGDESGNGLPNMQQRMESIGGTCQVDSAPGRGTTIQFRLELKWSGKGRVHS